MLLVSHGAIRMKYCFSWVFWSWNYKIPKKTLTSFPQDLAGTRLYVDNLHVGWIESIGCKWLEMCHDWRCSMKCAQGNLMYLYYCMAVNYVLDDVCRYKWKPGLLTVPVIILKCGFTWMQELPFFFFFFFLFLLSWYSCLGLSTQLPWGTLLSWHYIKSMYCQTHNFLSLLS